MTKGQTLYMHASVAVTAVTGAVFAWMKYGMKSDDPFSVVNHPLQPWMLSAHVVIAPILVFGFGWIFSDHIWPRFRSGRPSSRRSGIWSMAMIVPMTLSAYLLQASANEALRRAMTITHWATSALFVVGYGAHLVAQFRPVRRRVAVPAERLDF